MALLKSTNKKKEPNKAANRLGSEQIDYYAGREFGESNYDRVPLELIDMDDTNPRTQGVDAGPLLALVPKFIILDRQHKSYSAEAINALDQAMDGAIAALISQTPERKEAWTKMFSSLKAFALNIRRIGVKQPIEVKREGRRYTIIYGHRRYLASILAGERTIPARIVSDTRHGNKLIQASENLLQEELTLDQRLETIASAIKDLEMDIQTLSVTAAANILGYGRIVLGRHIGILRHGSDALFEAIKANKVVDAKVAVKLAKLSEEECIEALKKLDEKGKVAKPALPKKTGSRGPKRKKISTPSITNTGVVRHILGRLNVDTASVDWDDMEAVNACWKDFIMEVHAQCKKGE